MIFSVEVPIIADCVLRLFDVNNFLKMLTIFKSRLFKLMQRCIKRETLNSFDFDRIIFLDNEELNSKSRTFENK